MGEGRSRSRQRCTGASEMIETSLPANASQGQEHTRSEGRELAREERSARLDLPGARVVVGRYAPHRTGDENIGERQSVIASNRMNLRRETTPMKCGVQE